MNNANTNIFCWRTLNQLCFLCPGNAALWGFKPFPGHPLLHPNYFSFLHFRPPASARTRFPASHFSADTYFPLRCRFRDAQRCFRYLSGEWKGSDNDFIAVNPRIYRRWYRGPAETQLNQGCFTSLRARPITNACEERPRNEGVHLKVIRGGRSWFLGWRDVIWKLEVITDILRFKLRTAKSPNSFQNWEVKQHLTNPFNKNQREPWVIIVGFTCRY